MAIQRVGVVGAGQMGSGIAHVAALAGRAVVLVDVSEALVAKGRKAIEKNLGRQAEKGKVTAEPQGEPVERRKLFTQPCALAAADLVVEAIVENDQTKSGLLRR